MSTWLTFSLKCDICIDMIKGENVAKEGRFKKAGGRTIGGCQPIEGEIV